MEAKVKEKLLHMFNSKAPIVQLLGMKLSFDDEDNAIVDLPYNPKLDHSHGVTHGGVYTVMLDSAGWFTAVAHRSTFVWLVTSHLSVHFLLPAKETSLRAIGKVIKSGKRQDVVEVRLYNDQQQLTAYATATFTALEQVNVE